MKVSYTTQVAKFVDRLSYQDHARLNRTRDLFEDYGFQIGQRYIKKVTKSGIWELRAGNIRLFLCIRENLAVGVHIIHKKSQKLSLKDVRLVEKRCKEV